MRPAQGQSMDPWFTAPGCVPQVLKAGDVLLVKQKHHLITLMDGAGTEVASEETRKEKGMSANKPEERNHPPHSLSPRPAGLPSPLPCAHCSSFCLCSSIIVC